MTSGILKKMRVTQGEPVKYELCLGEDIVEMNSFLGKRVTFQFKKEIFCVGCGAKIRKSFAQGYCFSCFQNSPQTSPCILKPELCQAQWGIARDLEWAQKHHLQAHCIYLALSSDVKVGVTRETQIPVRWIDQGATQAIVLAKVPNRHIAGVIECFLKQYLPDKTSWQKMLTNNLASEVDLVREKRAALEKLPGELKRYGADDDTIFTFEYPVLGYPEKVKTRSFDKELEISGILTGIKGQYLIFEDSTVLNIRKHTGYKVEFKFE